MSAHEQSSTSDPTTRRRLLGLLGAGGAALVATTLPLKSTEATHVSDAPDPGALHVGQTNPADATTTLEADLADSVDDHAYTLVVTNESGRAGKFESQGTQALEVISHGGDECAFAGMFTAEDSFGLGASSRGVGMRAQGARGAFIGELLNEFAAEDSPNAAVVGVAEAGGVNCPLETPCTSPGSGVGVRGIAGAGTGVEGMSLGDDALIHVGDCAYQIPLWEPLAGPLGSGIGVLGRSGSGPGVRGTSVNGPGVEGTNTSGVPEPFAPEVDGHPGVIGTSTTGPGVHGANFLGENPGGVITDLLSGVNGVSQLGPGVFGHSITGPGIEGVGANGGAGALGWSSEGAGVVGIGSIDRGGLPVPEAAPGVMGIAPGAAAAVRCVSGYPQSGSTYDALAPVLDDGLALDVVGKARFSTAGAATVPQGQNSVVVANAAVTPASHISITLVSDPGPRQLRWVQRAGGSGFTVFFTGGPPGQRPATDFTYLIVEPAGA